MSVGQMFSPEMSPICIHTWHADDDHDQPIHGQVDGDNAWTQGARI